MTVTGLVLCVVGIFCCDDLDSTACARLASLRPDMCNDTCFVSVCKRYCGQCRKYKHFHEHINWLLISKYNTFFIHSLNKLKFYILICSRIWKVMKMLSRYFNKQVLFYLAFKCYSCDGIANPQNCNLTEECPSKDYVSAFASFLWLCNYFGKHSHRHK